MLPQETIHRELEQHYSAELAKTGRGLRPWFARPVVLVGAIAAGSLILLLALAFLRAAPM